jgi:hypothetical protein
MALVKVLVRTPLLPCSKVKVQVRSLTLKIGLLEP